MKNLVRLLKVLALLAVLGGVGAWAGYRGYQRYLEKKRLAAASSASGPEAARVSCALVTARDLRRVASLTGTVKPMVEVRVMSKVSGRLDLLRLEDGTPIELGTVIPRKGVRLAVIDHEAFAAQVRQAEATVRSLEAELTRVNAKARPEELRIAEANVKAAEASVAAARANVAQALASLDNARKEMTRVRRLFDEKVATQQQLDNAHAQETIAEERHRAAGEQARAAEQQLRAALEQLALVEQGARKEDRDAVAAKIEPAKAALELARINLEESTIKAPVAGVVSVKNLDEGNMVSPGVPIVTIVQVDTVKVVVGVAERELPFIKEGVTRATLSVDAFPGMSFAGTVQKISPVVDERTRTVEVEIHVPNPDLRLKPGMFARVELLLQEKKGVPAIPEHAVTWLDEKPFVTIVNAAKAHRIPVKLGLADGPIVEVLEGLEPGALVVTRGQQGLKDGQPVIATEEGTRP